MEQQVAENLFQESVGSDYENVEVVQNGDLVNTYVFDHDPDYVLQFPRMDSRGFDIGVNCYEDLQGSAIPVPEIIDKQNQEDSYVVLEYLPGDDLNSIQNPENHLFYQAGEILASIHQEYDFDGYGFLSTSQIELPKPSKNWKIFFQARTGSRIDELEGEYIDLLEAASLEEAVSDKAPVEPEATLLHNDYAGRNIRVDSEVKAILDFDSSFVGDPDFDFVKSKQSFIRDFGESEASSFEEGYRSRKELGKDFSNKELAYRISELIGEAWALKALKNTGRRCCDEEEIEELVSNALELC